jgi:hypothetical protein
MGCLWVTSSHCAELEITFTKPDTYTDIRSGFDGPNYSAQDIATNLEKHLTRLAKKLPDEYQLKMDVTDIDLAGDTRRHNMRVVTERLPPRLAFSYSLLDANDQVLIQSNENIRDFAFMSNRSLRLKGDPFGHEKKLLSDWFKKLFQK